MDNNNANNTGNNAGPLLGAVGKAVLEAKVSLAGGAPGLPPVEGLEPAGAIARLAGNVKLYTKSLGMFCQGIPQYSADMAAALEAGDRPTLQRLAHTVKGLAATVGAPDISSAAAHLEHSLNDQGFTPERALLDDLSGRMHQLASAVAASGIVNAGQPAAQAAGQPTGQAAAAPGAQTARGGAETLARFKQLLADDDATAPDFFAEHKARFDLPADAVLKIEACLRAYDFEEALDILKAAG